MIFTNLETPRMILKNIGPEDREFILKQFSNESVNEFLFDEEPMKSLSDADELIDFYTQPEPRDQHRWILIRKEDGVKMGTCGFHCWNREEHRCEIGYDLHPGYRNMGYVREALETILPFAKEKMGIRIMDATVYVDNERSKHVVSHFGFKDSGRRFTFTFRGQEYPEMIFTLEINE